MPKRYKYRKPKTSTVSTVPTVYGLRNYVEMMNVLTKKVPQRIDRGRELFLLSMAEFVRRRVQQAAPNIDVGGKEYPYAEHLRLAIVDGVPSDEDAVAIFFENQSVVLSESNMDGKVLFFQPSRMSPEFVRMLMVYGPWPASMVPVPVDGIKARVISRNARADEIDALSDRIYANRGKIESDLNRAGAKDVDIKKTSGGVGIVVHEDVGYNVLRVEFGYDGKQQNAHWRPALRSIKEVMPDLMKRYLKYLTTGRESVFEIPSGVGNISAQRLNEGAMFARELAPFAPRG